MKLLKGARSLRRYNVEGDFTLSDINNVMRCFQENAFHQPLSNLESREKVGWTTGDSLLDNDFAIVQKWFTEPYIYAMMRIDKKTLPNNLFKARYNDEIEKWLQANNAERISAAERQDIKDVLTAEMMAQTLPNVKTVEFCWHVEKKYLIVLNTSDTVNEKFASLFYKTFGLTLRPFSPLMFLNSEDSRVQKLINCGISNFQIAGTNQ